MKRTLTTLDKDTIPSLFHPLLDAPVYDSSCSNAARVYLIDKDGGYYLKKADKNALQKEAAMTRFFHSKQLGAEVLAYESLESDWMLTSRVPGEDCTTPMYLEDPARLAESLGQLLRMLHSVDMTGCPVHRTTDYIATACRNYAAKKWDESLFPDNWGYATAEDAWRVVEENTQSLKSNVLLHGDYCLPNIMLDDWKFSGFIDLDTGGIGDRHIDLFWGIWSLNYNLKTDAWRARFLDAYGREDVEEEMLRVISAFEVFG